MAGLYLALREINGPRLVNLTDTTKYQIIAPTGGSEWVPAVGVLVNDRYSDVTEQIPIDIVGATGAIKLTNLQAITELIDQAQAWARGENVNPVVLDYAVAGSAPQRILSRMIFGWTPDGYLPGDFNHRVAVMDRFSIVLSITCLGEWLQTSWGHPNLAVQSIWETNPSYSVSVGSLTFTNATTAGKAKGYLSHAHSTAAAILYTSLGPVAAITNGKTYSVSVRVADSLGGQLTVEFRNNANTLTISSVPATQAVAAGGSVLTGGQVLVFTVTATATDANALLRLTFTPTSATAGTFTFCEPQVLEGSFTATEEPWHPNWDETTKTILSTSTGNPVVQTVTLPFGDTLSPCDVQVELSSSLSPLPESYIIATPTAPTIADITVAGAGNWTAQAVAAADFAVVDSVRRYTPASTAEDEYAINTLGSKLKGPVLVFASARTINTASSFLVKARFKNGGVVLADTTGIVVPASATSPQWYPLGLAVLNDPGSDTPFLVAQATTTSGAPAIEFDQVVYVPLVRGTGVWWIDQVSPATVSKGFTIEHRLLEARAARVSIWTSTYSVSASVPVSYRSGSLPRMKDSLNVVWLACANGDWRISNSGGTLINNMTTRVTRTPSYQTPR